MVPSSYLTFYDAASQAAGALIGLLFVVIALRPDRIVGPRADAPARGLAASSFNGLVNAFFVSLLALIPGHKIGIGATIVAALSLYHTLRLHLRGAHLRHGDTRDITIFSVSLLTYGFELGLGIAIVLSPHDVSLVDSLTFVLIGCFSVALSRAWQLMQSAIIGTESPSAAAPAAGTDR